MPQIATAETTVKRPGEKVLIVQLPEPLPFTVEKVAATSSKPTDASAEDEPLRKKPLRLGRIIRQLNLLKAGEPIEWQEVGIQPKVIMARAAEKNRE